MSAYPPEEIDATIQKCEQNWIRTVEDWKSIYAILKLQQLQISNDIIQGMSDAYAQGKMDLLHTLINATSFQEPVCSIAYW